MYIHVVRDQVLRVTPCVSLFLYLRDGSMMEVVQFLALVTRPNKQVKPTLDIVVLHTVVSECERERRE